MGKTQAGSYLLLPFYFIFINFGDGNFLSFGKCFYNNKKSCFENVKRRKDRNIVFKEDVDSIVNGVDSVDELSNDI